MIPGALPFTSSAAASNNLQAGRNFPSQAEFAWKCPDRKHLTATPSSGSNCGAMLRDGVTTALLGLALENLSYPKSK